MNGNKAAMTVAVMAENWDVKVSPLMQISMVHKTRRIPAFRHSGRIARIPMLQTDHAVGKLQHNVQRRKSLADFVLLRRRFSGVNGQSR